MILPPDGVAEALHVGGDMLEVPQRLALLLHVRVLQLRHGAGPHDLVRVRLKQIGISNPFLMSFASATQFYVYLLWVNAYLE